jgi:hypothetical protein
MIAVRVTFQDGNALVSSINATLEEARAYYLGSAFQSGDTDGHPGDNMQRAVRVQEVFTLNFAARRIGSIGAWERFSEDVAADSRDAAILSLYDKYDHISFNC